MKTKQRYLKRLILVIGVMQPQVKGDWSHQKMEEERNGFSSKDSNRNTGLLTPCLWPVDTDFVSSLKNCEKAYFCSFRPPGL